MTSSELIAEWNDLADRTHAAPFLRPGWFAAWSSAFGGPPIEVLTVRREGRLAGVVPLVRTGRSLRSPTNWHTPGFGPIAEAPADVQALAEIVLARSPRQVRTAFLDADHWATNIWSDAMRAGRRLTISRVVERPPYVAIDGPWADYERTLSRKLMKDVRRRWRKLQEEMSATVDVLDGSADLDGALRLGFDLERSGWKGRGGSAIASRRDTDRFYRELARWAAGRGILRLLFLNAAGGAIGFQFALEDDGVFYLLKSGFDPAAERFSPGKLMREAGLRRAFDLGLRRYEFLGAATPSKLEWTSTCHERLVIQSFRRDPAGSATWAAYAWGRPMAKRAVGAWRSIRPRRRDTRGGNGEGG